MPNKKVQGGGYFFHEILHCVLHTAKYRDACTALGVFIDHDPAGALDEDDKREMRLLLTKTHYKLIFNDNAPQKLWELKFDKDFTLTSDDDENENRRRGRKVRRLKGSMQIFVEMKSEKRRILHVDPFDSVWSLKMHIEVVLRLKLYY